MWAGHQIHGQAVHRDQTWGGSSTCLPDFPAVFQRLYVGKYRLRDAHPASAIFHAVDLVVVDQLVDSASTSSAHHRLRYGHAHQWRICG